MLCIQDLVDQPDLRLTVLAGEGGMARQVTWAHASDLPDPWDWLGGGEVLMKNGRSLPRSASGQVAFLERLYAADVSALLIGADLQTPALHPKARRRADELSLPVVQVPYSMSFLVVSRAVADATVETQTRRIARVQRIYAAIQAAVRRPGQGTLLRHLEDELGHRIHVLDAATGEVALVGPAHRPPDARLLDQVRATLAGRDGQLPAVIRLPDTGRRSAVIVEVPAEEPTILVAERRDGRAFDVSMLHHAATAAGVAVAHASLQAEFDAQVRAAVLLRAIDGWGAPAELAEAGIELPSAKLLVVRCDPDAATLRRLGAALRREGVGHLMAGRDRHMWVLLSGQQEEAALTAVGGDGATGLSGPVGTLARMPEAAREAAWASALAGRRGGGLIRYAEPISLPALGDPEAARALVAQVLGPLLAYDREHGAELVASLRVFLGCQRSWSRTAAALRMHRQTVIYRMRRVAELTGRDIAETADLAELWLALAAQDLLVESGDAIGSGAG